jgi:N-acetylglucosamine kinase-like BadF-type ATPase
MKYFLGVDGGQSGTIALIGDETGRVLGSGSGGPCNHAAASEGRARLEGAVRESVGAACREAGLESSPRFEAACFGMSGGPEDKRAILETLVDTGYLIVTTDAAIALAGATASGNGLIVIAGTGSMAFGRNEAIAPQTRPQTKCFELDGSRSDRRSPVTFRPGSMHFFAKSAGLLPSRLVLVIR